LDLTAPLQYCRTSSCEHDRDSWSYIFSKLLHAAYGEPTKPSELYIRYPSKWLKHDVLRRRRCTGQKACQSHSFHNGLETIKTSRAAEDH